MPLEGQEADVRNRMLFDRPRLRAAIRTSLERGVAAVIAPGGFGKTTLAESIAAEYASVAKVRLSDSTLLDFVRALVVAIRSSALRDISGVVSSAGNDDMLLEDLAAWLAPMISHELVVLDQLELIASDVSCVALLTRLIAATRKRTGWLLLSQRSDKLPLQRWYVNEWMTRPLQRLDLTFIREDIRAFADALALRIEGSELDRLLDITYGWPVAVTLALDLVARGLSTENVMLRTARSLGSYIALLLRDLAPDEERALIACSLMGRFPISLMERAGISIEVIRTLSHRFPFIQIGDSAIDLHPLVVDRREEYFDADRIRLVGESLALAIETEDPVAALRIARSCELSPFVYDVLRRRLEDLCLRYGAIPDVARGLEFLAQGRGEYENILAMQGILLHLQGDGTHALDLLKRSLLTSDRDWRAKALMRLSLLESTAGRRPEALAYAAQLTEDTYRETPYWLLGVAKSLELSEPAGDVRAQLHVIAQMIHALEPAIRIEVGMAATSCAFELRDARLIAHFLAICSSAAQELGDTASLSGAHRMAAYHISITAYDFDATIVELNVALAYAEESGNRALIAVCLSDMISHLIAQGNSRLARTYRERLDALPSKDPPAFGTCEWADILALEGNLPAALARLEPIHSSEITSDIDELINGYVAVYSAQLGDMSRSAACLKVAKADLQGRASYGLGWRSAIARLYALAAWALDDRDRAEREIEIASAAATTSREQKLSECLQNLQRVDTRDDPAIAAIAAEFETLDDARAAHFIRAMVERRSRNSILTRSERAVLAEFYASGGTAAEVGLRLQKSTHTVQAQLRNASRKLGCRGRQRTLQVARSRGLI